MFGSSLTTDAGMVRTIGSCVAGNSGESERGSSSRYLQVDAAAVRLGSATHQGAEQLCGSSKDRARPALLMRQGLQGTLQTRQLRKASVLRSDAPMHDARSTIACTGTQQQAVGARLSGLTEITAAVERPGVGLANRSGALGMSVTAPTEPAQSTPPRPKASDATG